SIAKGQLDITNGRATLRGALDRPGFLRLELTLAAGADTLHKVSACGFAVNAIRPTNVPPDDFERFWRQGRAELLRVPPDAQLEAAPDTAHPGHSLYKLSLGNIEGSRIFGWLRIPAGDGPFPAVLRVPGAGVNDVGSPAAFADSGFVVLSIEIHGIGVGLDDKFYRDLSDGLLAGYRHFGDDDPYRFYYRRVILGAIRSIDYLCSHPDVDSAKVAITGGSQGGALSLLVAGLDRRIKALAANVPAMCDHSGELYGRPSGWPRLLRNAGDRERALRTSRYYDAALNAGFITVPALLGVGFIDDVCAPTSVYAAYNNLQGYKEIDNFPDMGHGTGPGWYEKSIGWLKKALNGGFAM
ncbi:MAG TPA: acetylxylan esterase, partial [Candidatus Glassbacteria bacterium]|nr:acetylxylan esterase [Candidatus Glassbacteria bacterium]